MYQMNIKMNNLIRFMYIFFYDDSTLIENWRIFVKKGFKFSMSRAWIWLVIYLYLLRLLFIKAFSIFIVHIFAIYFNYFTYKVKK